MDSVSLRNLLIILSTAVVAVVFQFHFDTWTFQHAANAIPSALTYLNATQKPRRYDAIRILESYDKDPDTTVVILNWSRLENVKRIVKGHCNLPQVIAKIYVWNNNPLISITNETFSESNCPSNMLRTYNSPTNLYFYARYLACRESETKYCFIQDDDYLILPSVLLNMHSYFLLNPNMTSLHLLPPHEHLSSRLRTVYEPENGIYSSFAWLGHGTFLRRSTVEEFLALLQELQFSEAERQMADNYFTILANKVPEIWFDHGIELRGGQPFTVGAEGQTRNERHISKAMEYLRATLEARKLQYMPYISEGSTRQNFIVNSSPIKHSSGVLFSNIKLFSRKSDLSKISDSNLHQDMSLDDDDIRAYIVNPLSNIVDGDPRTSFISPNGAEPGDWLVYDTLGPLDSNGSSVELVLLAEGATADMLTACTFSRSFGDKIWEIVDTSAVCKETDLQSPNGGRLSECSIQMVGCDESSSFRAFKVTFSGPERKHVWSINEMFVRMVKD